MDKKSLKSCPKTNTPYLYKDDRELRTRRLVKASCKQWKCEYCSQMLQRIASARIINGYNILVKQGYQFQFVTLTMHENLRTFESTVRVWRSVWKKLQARMRRHEKRQGRDPQFVYVPEKHKDGRCHIHGLFASSLTERWWKSNLRECGGGYQARSVDVENAGLAGWYCAKYLSKNSAERDWIPYFRRINFSRKYPTLPQQARNAGYSILPTQTSLLECAVEGWSAGYSVYVNGDLITSDDFLD